MKSSSQIRELTRTALLVGIFGVLVLLNVQSGLLIETYFPFIFALPIFVSTAAYGLKTGILAFVCMSFFALTLSGLTTWFYTLTWLTAGFLTGCGFHRNWNRVFLVILVSLVLAVSNYLSMSVLASMLGYDPAADMEMAAKFSFLLSWQGFLVVFSLFMGTLQGIACFLFGLILCRRLPQLKLDQPVSFVKIPKAVSWIFLILSVLLIINWKLNAFPVFIRDLFSILWIICFCMLVYEGWRSMLKHFPHSRGWFFTGMLAMFIPIVNLVYVVYGGYQLLKPEHTRN